MNWYRIQSSEKIYWELVAPYYFVMMVFTLYRHFDNNTCLYIYYKDDNSWSLHIS